MRQLGPWDQDLLSPFLGGQPQNFMKRKTRCLCVCGDDLCFKGRHQNSLPLTTNVSQKLTQPSKGISYPVGDLCRCFTKLTGSSAYTLHSNLLPPTDGTNGPL